MLYCDWSAIGRLMRRISLTRSHLRRQLDRFDGLLTNTTVMSSVTAMLKELDWQPLELRRFHSRLCLLYQITNGIAATPHIPYLLPHSHASRSSRHAHTLQHATYQCRTNYFKYSYFPHTIVLWNALPQAVVSSPTLVAFKTSLRRGRMPQNCNLDSGGDIVITL